MDGWKLTKTSDNQKSRNRESNESGCTRTELVFLTSIFDIVDIPENRRQNINEKMVRFK